MLEIRENFTINSRLRQRWSRRLRTAGLNLTHWVSAALGLYAIVFTYLSLSQVTHEKRLRDVQRLLIIGLLDAESGQRAFLLTDDAVFLDQYAAGLKALDLYEPVYAKALKDPRSEHLFEEAHALLALKRAEMQLTISTHQTVSAEAAVQIVRNRVGHRYTEQIYELLGRIRRIESHHVAPFELWHAPHELDIHDATRFLSSSALLTHFQ